MDENNLIALVYVHQRVSHTNGWLVDWFYGILTFVGYLMLNPVYTYILNI